jgi:uncharacterized membrane protein YebE (DUF533 family)
VEDAQALEVTARAAKAGGLIALARLGKTDYMRWKGHRDVVSGATLEVQDDSRARPASCDRGRARAMTI